MTLRNVQNPEQRRHAIKSGLTRPTAQIYGSTCADSEKPDTEELKPCFPDKICDQISDAVLDAHLRQDPDAKVACGE